jgi:uncharacterized membrane protein
VQLGRILMGAMYVAAGLAHFAFPHLYQSVVPDYLPAHHALVMLSGVAEIAGGVGVTIPATRRAAAWGLVLLLVAVCPANTWMVQHPERFPQFPFWSLCLRLPLQLLFIAWAWRYTRRPGGVQRSDAGGSELP